MKAVITGDIINSRSHSPSQNLTVLKGVLREYGDEPHQWEIYRGDSFQLILDHPADSFNIAMRIKAALKTQREQDVRMSIGIGQITYEAQAVTESNGEAFVHSGKQFEELTDKKVNLAIRTPWSEFDEEMNLYFQLALIVMDAWSKASAEYINIQLAEKNINQDELAKLLGIGQSSVSERKKRAHYDALMQLDQRFKDRVEGYL